MDALSRTLNWRSDQEADFAGHEHLYNHTRVEGVHQVIAGTCGAPIYTGHGGDFYHYALVTVDGLDVSVSVFDDNREMRDYFEYTEADCGDETDNDGDGLIDYPADPGCTNSASNIENSACQDGNDNDRDGLIDFDGGQSIWGECTGQPEGCPNRVSDPEGDGVANPDPQCVNSYRKAEASSPSSCGLGAELALLLLPLIWLHRRGSRKV